MTDPVAAQGVLVILMVLALIGVSTLEMKKK